MSFFRFLFLALAAAALVTAARAGVAPYTDPGKIDFDTAIQLLNPYGTWTKVGDKWTYTPLDHAVPYTNGRWLYSEYGWLWKGNSPTSWATEHYGYWKRGADKVWTWYPGPNWLPQIVEIRASPTGIGWRSAEVDTNGNFVEAPADRFTKTDEWTFVTPAVFAGPITPAVIAPPAQAVQLLEQSTDSVHSYLTYREIDRPGPHPADFVNLGDGGMFAPMNAAERYSALHPLAAAAKAEAKPAKIDPAKVAASLTASDPLPEIPQQPGGTDPNDDPRQVKYWVTMSLPTVWTAEPPEVRRNEVYLYRPDFYQDEDGIARRIAFWLNPSLRSSEAVHLADVLKNHSSTPPPVSGYSSAPATPAAPAPDFPSPFDTPFRTAGGTESSKAPAPAAPIATNAPAPAGRAPQ